MAFYNLEPFGHIRGDLQAGIVASTIANVNSAKGSKTYQPIDFMPIIDRPDQSPEDMKQLLTKMTKG